MFRPLKDQSEPTIDALIAADYAYSRRQAAFDALARRDMTAFAELTGDKSEELPTTTTDAARIGLCD